MLFLDEIDELELDKQAMILHAVESGKYFPLGSDCEVTSRFHLIAGASRDLASLVARGKFRAALFARLNLWTLRLPSQWKRPEDMAPNLEHEFERVANIFGNRVSFNTDAASAYLRFAIDPSTEWPGNFRDLGASVQRMGTLAPRGRVTMSMVEQETNILRQQWKDARADAHAVLLFEYLGDNAQQLDMFDQAQLASVIRICRESKSLSAAGRRLFAVSRVEKKSTNDAGRLRKYLEKHSLSRAQLVQ